MTRVRTSWPLALAAGAVIALAGDAWAQGSRLNITSPPSKLRQRGPVTKVANPAAPLKMPAAKPSTPNEPGAKRHRPRRVRYHYPYPYHGYSRYNGYGTDRYPVYYDLDLGFWYGYDYWSRHRSSYDGPLLVEQVRKYDPGVINEAPAPVREIDEGLGALRAEDYRLAADIYARRVAEQIRTEAKDPPPVGLSDREEQRFLAVALIGDNRMEDALRHALEAYRHDASLRSRPILGSSIIPSRAERMNLTRRAVNFAQRRDAPNIAWFLAAILMEADDRANDARRVLARAEIDLDELSPALPVITPAATVAPQSTPDPPVKSDQPDEPDN